MLYRSRSPEETFEAGRRLGACLDAQGGSVALVGPLGAGKTVFVRGLAAGLGVDTRLVASPTFVIVNEYPSARRPLVHVDLYRVADASELEATGFLDWLAPGAVVAVEWADRIPEALPPDHLEVALRRQGGERELRVRAFGPLSAEIAADYARELERAGLAGAAGEA